MAPINSDPKQPKEALKLLSRAEYYDRLKTNQFGECAFCEWQERQIVLNQTEYWLWIASISPYWKYHTMFMPKRHITDIDQLTDAEFHDFKEIKAEAVNRCAKADLRLPDGTPVNVFNYSWRVREGGIDTTAGVVKSMHLHIHMWPEKDGLMSSITDPEAFSWDVDELRRTNAQDIS